jgi:hypothetical protein
MARRARSKWGEVRDMIRGPRLVRTPDAMYFRLEIAVDEYLEV